MMNIEQAKQLALKKLEEIQKKTLVKLAIMEEHTLPFKDGWVFFYQSEEFVETKDPEKMVGGNAPILVDKQNGNVLITGTSKDISYYIDTYTKMKTEWRS